MDKIFSILSGLQSSQVGLLVTSINLLKMDATFWCMSMQKNIFHVSVYTTIEPAVYMWNHSSAVCALGRLRDRISACGDSSVFIFFSVNKRVDSAAKNANRPVIDNMNYQHQTATTVYINNPRISFLESMYFFV